MTTTQYTFGEYSVCLGLDHENPLGDLEDLHICHLGMKFISPRALPEFSVYEFDMAIKPVQSGEAVSVRCSGIVVSCEPEGTGFRSVIHFSGLGKDEASHLETVTKDNRMRCDYCANC